MKPKSKSRKSPAAARRAFWLCAIFSALWPALLLSGCRQDMHVQPRYQPEDPSTFFADGRSERPPVQGTVARGQLRTDGLLYTGRINGVAADVFPFPMTATDLSRGRERYNIYCSPCHDYTGSGNGMIVQRGFPSPPSLHIERLRQAPAGHFFEVMTNGLGLMYSYASRVSPEDRWCQGRLGSKPPQYHPAWSNYPNTLKTHGFVALSFPSPARLPTRGAVA